jgi:hypothetical protein
MSHRRRGYIDPTREVRAGGRAASVDYGCGAAQGDTRQGIQTNSRLIILDDPQTHKRCIACPSTWNPTAAL